MYPHRIRFFVLLLGGFLSLTVSLSRAATPNQNFDAQANADSQLITRNLNRTFAGNSGFFTSLGWNSPSSGFELLLGPRMELGIDLGADFVSFPSFASLPLGALRSTSIVTMPSNLPAPYTALTGRVVLFHNFDAGVRMTYLPVVNFADTGITTNFIGLGFEARYKILEGVGFPDISLGLSWDTQAGNFSKTSGVNQASTYTDPTSGLVYDVSVVGNSLYSMKWDVRSLGVKMVLGKDLGAAYPFIAVGFQTNTGTVSSNLSGPVTATLSGPPGGGTSTPDITSSSSTIPVDTEPKFAIGIDTGRGFHWTLVGESNGTDVAVDMSFRAQF
jgi:hypothetical protein